MPLTPEQKRERRKRNVKRRKLAQLDNLIPPNLTTIDKDDPWITKARHKLKPERNGIPSNGGRPVGSRSRRTLAREQLMREAAALQVSPLHVMLKRMGYHYERAQSELKMPKPKPALVKSEYALAAEAAQQAAPYIHPRLQAINHSGKVEYTNRSQILGNMTPQQAAQIYAETLRALTNMTQQQSPKMLELTAEEPSDQDTQH